MCEVKPLRVESYCSELADGKPPYRVRFVINGYSNYLIQCDGNRDMAVRLVAGSADKLIQQVYELGIRDGQKALRDELARVIGIEQRKG
jgi:hypothetical protein